MTDTSKRCPCTTETGLQCQLMAGHASAHAARSGQALVSWHNQQAGDAGSSIGDLEWFEASPAE